MKTKIRVLVTCAGGGVGQSAIDGLRGQKDSYFILASDQQRFSYAIPDCDGFVDLPRIADPDYVKTVRQVCARYQIDVLIPGHDQELELFAQDSDGFAQVGTKVLVSDYPLVKLLRNKLEWARSFRQKTDRVVRSLSVGEVATAPDLTFPMIAKPSGGSASSGLHILHGREDAIGLPDDLVVQDFLYPRTTSPDYGPITAALAKKQTMQLSEISVQLLYAQDSTLMGRFASQNRLNNGIPVEIMPVDSEEIWRAVSEIETILAPYKPRGPMNLQGRLTEDGLVFFEMNPRFTGITGNRVQFGFNEVDAACRNAVTTEMPKTRINYSKVGVRQVACRTWPAKRFAFADDANPAKNIAVLGGTSWLGRTFASLCDDTDTQLVVISRPSSMDKAQEMFTDMAHVDVVSSDDASAVNALGWADALVNLASARPPSGTAAILASYEFQNSWLTKSVAANIPLIMNLSSQSVYQPSDAAWDEEAKLAASTPYAFSKFAIEQHLGSLQNLSAQTTTVSLRLSRLFGAADGMRSSEYPHLCVQKALRGEEIEVQAPDTVFDLLDVRDAASAIQFFLSGQHAGVFNIGSNQRTTVQDYLDKLGARALTKGYPALQSKVLDGAPATETKGGYMDCSKAHQAGWQPEYTIENSIDALFDWLGSATAGGQQ